MKNPYLLIDLFNKVHLGLKLALFFPLYAFFRLCSNGCAPSKSLQVVKNTSIFSLICSRQISLIAFFFWLTTFQCSAQNPIHNNYFKVVEKQIVITYDLEELDNEKSYYTVYLKISLDEVAVEASSFEGAIGEKIRGGKGKKIIWDVLSDVEKLDGGLEIQLLVDTYEPIKKSKVLTKRRRSTN